MNLDELVDISKQLKRADDNPEKRIDLLIVLSEQTPSRVHVKASKIAGQIKACSRSANPTEARIAKEVMAKWRELPKALKVKPMPEKTEKQTSSASDPMRAKIATLLCGVFNKDIEYPDTQKMQKADEIEAEMYASFLDVASSEYKEKYKTLKFNLKANHDLRLRVLDGGVLVKTLLLMTPAEMKTKAANKAMKQKLNDISEAKRSDWLDANRERINEEVGNKGGGMFKCGRCGSEKTTNYQKQTRSADEPMTVFVQCTNCPNRWRC